MSEYLLGQIPTEVHRDAVHVAYIVMKAKVRLRPGQHVNKDGAPERPYVGIVDPFLMKPVKEDQLFSLCLYPGTVTGMRHHWEHPCFPDKPAIENEQSVRFIEDFAQSIGKTYDALMSDLEQCSYDGLDSHGYRDGDYLYDNSERYKNRGDWEELWTHYEIVTNTKVSCKDCPYTCSC